MFIVVSFVLLHWLCDSYIPQLNLHKKRDVICFNYILMNSRYFIPNKNKSIKSDVDYYDHKVLTDEATRILALKHQNNLSSHSNTIRK